MRKRFWIWGIFLWVIFQASTVSVRPQIRKASTSGVMTNASAANSEDAILKDFAGIDPIDVHTHVYKDDPALNAPSERLNLRALNICVIDDRNPDFHNLEPQRTEVLEVRQGTRGRFAFCTTFSPYDFEQPGFSARKIRQLDDDFANGAVAVKIWKNIGMEIQTRQGKFVMPDDPAFEPIYKDIAAHYKTLIAHLAEPDSCWQPPNPQSPDYDYYKDHPEWNMYQHPDHPSKEAIQAARDHLVAENPELRVVGAHLGSMEANVDDIARRFDLYPKFAVEIGGRTPYLMLQPREKVRAFLIKYQDRVLYGTDLDLAKSADAAAALLEWERTYACDWRFFSTDQAVEYMAHSYQGLALPRSVLRRLFHDNALRWFPGIAGGSKGARRRESAVQNDH